MREDVRRDGKKIGVAHTHLSLYLGGGEEGEYGHGAPCTGNLGRKNRENSEKAS